VKAIKKMETARLGAESHARRVLYPEEYEQCIKMLEQIDDWEVSIHLLLLFFDSNYILLQEEMIARNYAYLILSRFINTSIMG